MKKTLLFFLILCSAVFIMVSCSSSSNEDRIPDLKSNLNIPGYLKEIIYYGSYAPSSHNAQMWKIEVISDKEFDILLDKNRLLNAVDPDRREAFISIGAFIENVSAASKSFNLKTEVTVLATNYNSERVAKIKFNSENFSDNTLNINNIKLRHSIKIPYKNKELDQKTIEFLISDNKDNIFYFDKNSKDGKYLIESTIAAMAKQVLDDNKQKELSEYMRFSDKEVNEKRDGISPEMMNITGVTKFFYSMFYNKDSVMKDDFRKQTVDITKNQAENCSGYFVLTVDNDSPVELIKAGMLSEKFWLRATEKKVAVQVMSQIFEESPWKENNEKELNLKGKMQMIFRTGFVDDYGYPVSKRIKIDDFVYIKK